MFPSRARNRTGASVYFCAQRKVPRPSFCRPELAEPAGVLENGFFNNPLSTVLDGGTQAWRRTCKRSASARGKTPNRPGAVNAFSKPGRRRGFGREQRTTANCVSRQPRIRIVQPAIKALALRGLLLAQQLLRHHTGILALQHRATANVLAVRVGDVTTLPSMENQPSAISPGSSSSWHWRT